MKQGEISVAKTETRNMRCPGCKTEMRRELRASYHYVECGLSNLHISDVDVDVCPRCDEEIVNIVAIARLHDAIAEKLIEAHERLSGEEIRYLRKHLGWGLDDFAKAMGVTEDMAMKWESDQAEMTLPEELTFRAVAGTVQPSKAYPPDRPRTTKTLTARRGPGSVLAWLLDSPQPSPV